MKNYILVIYEYFASTERASIIWNTAFPALLGGIVACLLNTTDNQETAKSVIGSSVSILGILVGFSISMFTLLNTAANPNIDTIKEIKTGKMLYEKPVFLFDLLLVSLIYVILGESLVLILNLLFNFFFDLNRLSGKIVFGIDVFLITHIIFTNISTIINFYFVLSKR